MRFSSASLGCISSSISWVLRRRRDWSSASQCVIPGPVNRPASIGRCVTLPSTFPFCGVTRKAGDGKAPRLVAADDRSAAIRLDKILHRSLKCKAVKSIGAASGYFASHERKAALECAAGGRSATTVARASGVWNREQATQC